MSFTTTTTTDLPEPIIYFDEDGFIENKIDFMRCTNGTAILYYSADWHDGFFHGWDLITVIRPEDEEAF